MKWPLLIVSVLCPISLLAETIDVRSGEHADFSRLVMQFTEQKPWNLNRTETGYVFTTNVTPVDFNTNDIFKYIPKTRISEVTSSSGGKLEIYTNENVHADAFELRAGRIVIDIKNGRPSPDSPFETPLSEQPMATVSDAPPIGDSLFISNAAGISTFSGISDPIASISTQISKTQEYSSPRSGSGNSFVIKQLDTFTSPSQANQNLEVAIAQELARAATSGTLEINPSLKLPANNDTKHNASELQKIKPLEPQTLDSKQAHIQINGAAKGGALVPALESFNVEKKCIPQVTLDILTWGTHPSETLLFAQMREKIIGEFDQPQIEGIRQLAQYYLYLTFGAEAQSVLSEFELSSSEDRVMMAMADIMDAGYSRVQSSLTSKDNQLHCGGAAGFWSAMAAKELQPGLNYPIESIISYFSALPLHLRRHLGPQLTEKFIKIENVSAAEMLYNAIARANGDHGDPFRFLTAEMSALHGDIPDAVTTLQDLTDSNTPLSPAALIKSIELRAEHGLDISPNMAERANILIAEHSGTTLEAPLREASILATIHSGSPVEAMKLLFSDTHIAQIPRVNLTHAALEYAYLNSDELSLPQVVSALDQYEALNLLQYDSSEKYADKLAKQGFTKLSKKLLMGLQDLTDMSRISLANAAAREGQLNEALGYLTALEGEDVSAQRASLLLQSGQPALAAENFEKSRDFENLDKANFLSGNWGSVVNAQDETLSSIATLMHTSENLDTSEATSLADLNLLIERSQAVRKTFSDVLNR